MCCAAFEFLAPCNGSVLPSSVPLRDSASVPFATRAYRWDPLLAPFADEGELVSRTCRSSELRVAELTPRALASTPRVSCNQLLAFVPTVERKKRLGAKQFSADVFEDATLLGLGFDEESVNASIKLESPGGTSLTLSVLNEETDESQSTSRPCA